MVFRIIVLDSVCVKLFVSLWYWYQLRKYLHARRGSNSLESLTREIVEPLHLDVYQGKDVYLMFSY